jgi:hypothetical protein
MLDQEHDFPRQTRPFVTKMMRARRRDIIIVGWLTGPTATLWLEFLYFTGCARLAEWWRAGEGVILKFERVRPPRSGLFQPLRSREIAPDRFERMLTRLRRWNYDIIPLGACIGPARDRAVSPVSPSTLAIAIFSITPGRS